MIKIKVCGMREENNVQQISMLPIDFMGFIFYDQSPRNVVFADIQYLCSWKKLNIKKVGVFVNQNPNTIMSIAKKYQLDFVQLHGNETSTTCDFLCRKGLKIIKAISIEEQTDIEKIQEYTNKVAYFLFDTKTKKYGGSGKKFNWDILKKYQEKKPFFLSGGIAMEDIISLSQFHHPQFFGIDLNSCFETIPARKDYFLLKQFIQNINTSNI
ncbi:MAG: phosphoribosylanthranilate isomerase [Chitinophagaceae bacterium]